MAFSGNCPNCGATVEFTAARSIVLVCGNCESVVGRAGDALENYGKVADLVQTNSPLQLGATGTWRGRPFEIVGRVQMKHATGAVWDEWYGAFEGGERWGWIAEAQNRVTLTFAKRIRSEAAVASLGNLPAGEQVTIPSVGKFTVAESGTATIGFAEGEIPFLVRPNTTYEYADLEGPHGRFATIDFRTSPPTAFVGGRVSYGEIGLEHAENRELTLPTAATVSVNCTNCGGSLDLRAPDTTERIVCPYCDSIHDVNQGNLKFLSTLKQDKTTPLLALGTKGTLRDREYTVIGHMRREVVVEGTHYPWDEYLLSTPRLPFAWLINANGHWMLGSAVSAGEVEMRDRFAHCNGRRFRLFDRTRPRVIAVHGEFPWKVQFGETVSSSDYISPPFMLSCEKSSSLSSPSATDSGNTAFGGASPATSGSGWGASAVAGVEARLAANRSTSDDDDREPIPLTETGPAADSSEAAWIEPVDESSASEAATSSQSKNSTQTKKPGRLPKSSSKKSRRLTYEINYTLSEYVPVQEVTAAFGLPPQGLVTSVAPAQPFRGFSLYATAALALLVIILLFALVSIVVRPQKVDSVLVTANTSSGATSEVWSEPFELKAGRNICLRCTVSSGDWSYFNATLFNPQTNFQRDFSVGIVGNEVRSKFLSSVPSGTYQLKIRPEFSSYNGQTLSIQVMQNVVNPTPWIWLILIPIGVLALVALVHGGFEQQRWSESGLSSE